MYVIGRRLEKERMREGMRDVIRINRCVRDWEKIRKGTDEKRNEKCHKKEQVCT